MKGRSRLLSLSAVLASIALLASLPGCAPGSLLFGSGAKPAYLERPLRAVPEGRFELRGNPGFSRDSLGSEARDWHEALWETLAQPEQRGWLGDLASSGNLYQYSRFLHTHIVALLAAFRVTGDLALLDEVDRLTQAMRAQLDDSWRGGNAPSRGGRDGYLNWVYLHASDRVHFGKDLHETDEMRTHALVAEVAWAFANNSDLRSPGGVDYGERAEFWLDYLRNHFEAKWRERNGVRWPKFPFLSRPYVHPTTAFVKYHHYLHLLTGEQAYRREAKRLSDLVFGEFREVTTDSESALVWRRAIINSRMSGNTDYLMPSTYSGYVMLDALDLYFEGFYGWADERLLRGLATTLSAFMIDNHGRDFARDIGGGVSRGGVRATSAREWERLSAQDYSVKPFAMLTAWDDSHKVREVSLTVYRSMPPKHRYVFLPAGMLIDAVLRTAEGSPKLAGTTVPAAPEEPGGAAGQ